MERLEKFENAVTARMDRLESMLKSIEKKRPPIQDAEAQSMRDTNSRLDRIERMVQALFDPDENFDDGDHHRNNAPAQATASCRMPQQEEQPKQDAVPIQQTLSDKWLASVPHTERCYEPDEMDIMIMKCLEDRALEMANITYKGCKFVPSSECVLLGEHRALLAAFIRNATPSERACFDGKDLQALLDPFFMLDEHAEGLADVLKSSYQTAAASIRTQK
ncbi:hypothetical protein N7461_002366 [Penicillium sp. DV-2018c]|nr:hypothetical protein N7461_002366 [Penicillium sp. DV-2018c]